MNTPIKNRWRKSGFTLTEVLIAASIALVVGGAAMTILITGIRSSLKTRSLIDNDISQWSIDSRLWVDSKIANGISIYSSFTSDAVKPWLAKSVESRGNLLILSLSQKAPNGTNVLYKKISGYEYIPSEKEIMRFEYAVSSSDQASFKSLEDILVDNMSTIKQSYLKQVSNIEANSDLGVFLCRKDGKAASLSCRTSAGVESNRTKESKLIEATFLIRN